MPNDLLTKPFFQHHFWRIVAALVLIAQLGSGGLVFAQTASVDQNPEAATGSTKKQAVLARHLMAAAAHPLAAKAGRQILAEGGSAVDAAIAMQMVLGLVEPQSSGLGGGAFMLTFDVRDKTLRTYDGRETAPKAARADRFMEGDRPMAFMDAVNSGKAVGVPGVLRMLERAHQRHGKLPWARLFEPAIALAETGFAITPRLAAQIAGNKALFAEQSARAYFYPQGTAPAVGTLLVNQPYADVLRRVASEGAKAFYEGDIAQDIVTAVASHQRAGDLSLEDLRDYRAKERDPVCSEINVMRICGMGPPSSGGIAVLQILGMLQQHQLADVQPASLAAVHYFSEAGRLAFADRERYVADPDFVMVPVKAMLDPAYLKNRGAWIDSRISMGVASAGELPVAALPRGRDSAPDLPSTTHMVAVDRYGNAISMTSSIEFEFGSKIFVHGFLLNNQLTDFSLSPVDQQGQQVANRVQANKRPRSAMAPMMVFKAGQPYLLLGSPGGSAIINFVAKTLIGVLDWQLDVQQAIDLPNMGSRNKETELERGTSLENYQADLQRMGHRVSILPFPSGIQAIMLEKNQLIGAADPRREGMALGD